MKILRLATLVLGLAAAAAQPLSAQTFGTEKRLFPHTVASISRDPYIHASGNNVYISWATFNSTTANHEVWVSVSTNNGDTFSTPVNVSQRDAAADQDINPVIVGDGTNVHVFWIDEVAGEDPNGANQNRGRIFYSRSTNNGASFSAPTVIVSQAGYSRVTSAVVSGSQVHLVFYDNRAIAGASIAGKVYHKLSCDNGASWSTETHVTQFDGDVDNEQPRIDKLSTGEIFLVYRSSAGGVPQGGWPPFQVYLLRQASAACPSGATWAYPAQRISRGPDAELGSNYAASIFPGLGGGLHVAWWSDSIASNLAYRYGKPNGAGFGAQQDLSQFGQNHLQWTDMAERAGFGIGEDASGRVHAIFLQNSSTRLTFQTGNIWYRCSPTAGGTFVSKQLATGALASEPRAIYSNNRFHMVWRDFRNTAIDQSEIYYNHVNTVGCAEPPPSSAPTPSTALLDFGGNSMNTTSLIRQLTLTNGGGGNLLITNLAASSGFGVAGTDCATVAPGGSCTVNLTFTPAVQGTVNGTLTITYSGGSSNVNLTGVGERSLVTHYYHAILSREPDSGKAYWEAEAARLSSLGVDINETWYVMAGYFFNSAEYLGYNKNDTQYVTDLYNTFFNRPPDSGGLNYWLGQIAGGLPREVVLFYFMFSPEFRTFTQAIFGDTSARPEVNVVIDFFRGILNRLPDTPSFNYWLGRMRTAQCTSAGAVYAEVNDSSYNFIFSAEYANRNRNNTQFVTDMYYAFLRRAGDAGGVQYWINELNTGARTIAQVRDAFIASPEFATRVNAIVSAGCLPP